MSFAEIIKMQPKNRIVYNLLTFLILLFLYSFCSILCTAIEDYYKISLTGIMNLDSYWICVSWMTVSSVIFFVCSTFLKLNSLKKSANVEERNSPFNFFVFVFLAIITLHISNLFYKYFQGEAGKGELMTLGVNIVALILFGLWFMYEKKWKNLVQYLSVSLISQISILVVGIACAQVFFPLSQFQTAQQDKFVLDQFYALAKVIKEKSIKLPRSQTEFLNLKDSIPGQKLDLQKVQYQKLNDDQFTLSFKPLSLPENYLKIRDYSHNHCFNEMTNGIITVKFSLSSIELKRD